MSVHIEAPTDAQLAFIRDLCLQQGWEHPAAIHSKAEASEIIGAMQRSVYQPGRYRPLADDPGWPADSHERDDATREASQRFTDYSDVQF